jgi:hypothetical protein
MNFIVNEYGAKSFPGWKQLICTFQYNFEINNTVADIVSVN